MPRVNYVKKSAKVQGNCSKCGIALPAGGAYRWWKFFRGGKYKRCMSPDCAPRPADLTQSEYFSSLFSQEDTFNSDVEGAEGVDAVVSALDSAADQARELGDEQQEKYDSMADSFQGGCPTMELLEERQQACEDLADEMESAKDQVEGLEEDEDIEDKDERVADLLQQSIDEAQQGVDFSNAHI